MTVLRNHEFSRIVSHTSNTHTLRNVATGPTLAIQLNFALDILIFQKNALASHSVRINENYSKLAKPENHWPKSPTKSKNHLINKTAKYQHRPSIFQHCSNIQPSFNYQTSFNHASNKPIPLLPSLNLTIPSLDSHSFNSNMGNNIQILG